MGWSSEAVVAKRFIGTDFIISSSGAFFYAGTPAAGNLTGSWAAASGTDQFGNPYAAGVASYNLSTGLLAAFSDAGIAFATPSGHPLSFGYNPVTNAVEITDVGGTPFSSGADGSLLIGNSLFAWIAPSGDTSGATDAARLNGLLAAGCAVHLMAGTYYVNAPLQYPAYATLRGAGRGVIDSLKQTVIQAAAVIDAVIAPAGWEGNVLPGTTPGGPRMSGFIVNGAGLATHGIVCWGEDSEFDDIGVATCSGDAIRFDSFTANGTTGPLGGSPVNCRVTRCSLENCSRGIATNQTSAKFTDMFITDNIIADMTGAASIFTTRAAGWKIDGCHLYGIAQNGIYIAQDFNTLVTGNYVESWGTSATLGTYAAITTSTGGTDGSSNNNKGSIIAGNRLALTANPGNAGSTIYGIRMRCLAANSTAVTVVGNSLECQPATAAFAVADAIEFRNNAATSVFTGVSTGNNVLGNWSNGVVQVPNGGTMTVTAGV